MAVYTNTFNTHLLEDMYALNDHIRAKMHNDPIFCWKVAIVWEVRSDFSNKYSWLGSLFWTSFFSSFAQDSECTRTLCLSLSLKEDVLVPSSSAPTSWYVLACPLIVLISLWEWPLSLLMLFVGEVRFSKADKSVRNPSVRTRSRTASWSRELTSSSPYVDV